MCPERMGHGHGGADAEHDDDNDRFVVRVFQGTIPVPCRFKLWPGGDARGESENG
jgi:hypothetical protein